jgi:hypothetical protein
VLTDCNGQRNRRLFLLYLLSSCTERSLAMARYPVEVAWKPAPTNSRTKVFDSFVGMMGRGTRWSSLAVALNMACKLAASFVLGRWSRGSVPNGMMRGIDFYPLQDLIYAVIHGAHRFKAENGYLPPLISPTTFNEHIFVRKYFGPLPMPSLADKLIAKTFAAARAGDEIIPAVVWRDTTVSSLFTADVPPGRYALKPNHGCQWYMFLNLPEDLTSRRQEIERKAAEWLNSRFGYKWGEWQYCAFKPELFLEEFIDFNGSLPPDDYKFWCFHGKVRLIEIDADRATEVRSAFYTPDWIYIPVTYGETPIQRPRPSNLEAMISTAQKIAGGMDFARIDLYTDGVSQIRFGEITFTPGDAGLHFSDVRLDQWLGTLFSRSSPTGIDW